MRCHGKGCFDRDVSDALRGPVQEDRTADTAWPQVQAPPERRSQLRLHAAGAEAPAAGAGAQERPALLRKEQVPHLLLHPSGRPC